MLTFNEIYERHAQDVSRYAYWLCGNADEADDNTSECFARAWAGREKIRTETVKACLFTVARNVYLHDYRRKKRQTMLTDYQVDTAPAHEQVVANRIELERVMALVQELSE